jgi:hypothetical protein
MFVMTCAFARSDASLLPASSSAHAFPQQW